MSNFYGGSDGGNFYPASSLSKKPVGYTDGTPFFEKAVIDIPCMAPGERILGYNYGYMANRREYRVFDALYSQQRLCSLNINWICLPVVNWQDTYHSTNIYADHLATPTDRDIEGVINFAHAKGKKVCLKPIVESKDHMWRAHIGFPDLNMEDMDVYWKAWFISYKNFLLHYAELAQELGCEMFCIGCEMLGTEHRKWDWLYLIEEVRKIYKGKIVYNTNHDHEEDQEWFNELDFIGTSAYYPVGGDSRSYDEMCKNWMTVRRRLDELAKKNDKQYIFMEIGCRSVEQASVHPWDFTEDLPFNEQEQADFYKSCYDVFLPSPYFAGIFWWDWPTKLYNEDKAKEDKGFCIYGKAAEQVVREYNLKFNRQILKRNN